MRGFSAVLTAITALTTVTVALTGSTANAAQETFVERCLKGTRILDSRLVCDVLNDAGEQVDITFNLVKGQKLYVNGSQLYVKRITHLPARVTDMGPMPEGLRFSAQGGFWGNVSATITLACGVVDFATVTLNHGRSSLGDETMALCQLR